MAKYRKTREEKIAASLKHQQQKQQQAITYSLPSININEKPVSLPLQPMTRASTVYIKDLQKTFFISFFLIISEIILYFLLHQHILKIPWTSY